MYYFCIRDCERVFMVSALRIVILVWGVVFPIPYLGTSTLGREPSGPLAKALHSAKVACSLDMGLLKRAVVCNGPSFRFHVSLVECRGHFPMDFCGLNHSW